eukprot:9503276-Pyramimonas_sp.AAC.1
MAASTQSALWCRRPCAGERACGPLGLRVDIARQAATWRGGEARRQNRRRQHYNAMDEQRWRPLGLPLVWLGLKVLRLREWPVAALNPDRRTQRLAA